MFHLCGEYHASRRARFVALRLCQHRNRIVLFELDRAYSAARVPAHVKLLCRDNSFGTYKLKAHAAHAHLVTIGIAPHIAKSFAGPKRNLAHCKRSARLSVEPLLKKSRIHERIEHFLARSPEGALHYCVAISWG